MSILDWVVLLGTLFFIVGYGVWKTRGKQDMEGYLRGGNSMKWWSIGLSVMATQASAITFLSTPGQAYDVYGNGNKSQIHWDMVCIQRPDFGGGEIWFDDVLVRKDGLFVLPELAGLNPDRLGR